MLPGAPGRRQAREQGGEAGRREGESEHGTVERERVVQAFTGAGEQSGQGALHPGREQHAQRAPEPGQHGALDQGLLHQPSSTRAEGVAHREFVLASGASRE